MALADGILVWLPLPRLLPWLTQEGPLSRLARIRARTVNQLSEEDLATSLALPEWKDFSPAKRYLGICTYQGELSEAGLKFVSAQNLARRAIFTGDVKFYLFLAAHQPKAAASETQRALLSRNPELQAVALSTGRAMFIAYPEAIERNPGLNRALRHTAGHSGLEMEDAQPFYYWTGPNEADNLAPENPRDWIPYLRAGTCRLNYLMSWPSVA